MSLKILNVSQNHYIRGGSDRYFFALADMLQNRGHQVIPFTAASPKNEPSAWDTYFPRGADFEHPGAGDLVRFLYSQDAVRCVRRLLRATPIDLAHLHIYYGKLTASILAVLKKAGIPRIQTLHEYKLTCPVYSHLSKDKICEACEGTHFYRALPKRCNRGSLSRTALSVAETYLSRMLGAVANIDHFISVSEFHRNKMISHGIPATKISTVHNFVDVSDRTPSAEVGEYLLYFGRVHRSKGIFTLLEAVAPLKHLPLYIVGEGDALPEVQRLCEENAYSHIHCLGFQQGQALRDLIRKSLCTVLPAEWYENCPMSILESYAEGKPVIGTAIGGIPELIEDGTDGCLVPVGNPVALRERLHALSEQRNAAVDMGHRGYHKLQTTFNADIHYERLMNIYRRYL